MRKVGKCGLILFALASSVLEAFVIAGQTGGEISLAEGTKISIQLNDYLSTKTNNEGDTFTAITVAPVYQGDRLVIPKGSVVTGSVSRILRPGRFRGKAVMNLLFQSIRISGRGQLPIVASLTSVDQAVNGGVHSEGTIVGQGSTKKDSARVLTPGFAGAGIGAIAGGGRGAAIGAGVGTAVGLATVFATRGNDLEVRRGSKMDITLERPLVVPVEAETLGARTR